MSGKSTRVRAVDLVAFLGPSLKAQEALRLVECIVMPPARQGDVWRALSRRPVAIALIDGLFEAEPSVWHHEILDALEAGVAVFGGASMGALRAAELWRFGMVGVGEIFKWYRDGLLVDDSEVALLHAGPEHSYEAFTVPLVNVRHAAALARKARVLSKAESEALVEEAAAVHFQDRTWSRVLDAAAPRWRTGRLERWRSWAKEGIEDLKRLDAIACLQAAAAFVESRRRAGERGEPGVVRVRSAPPSSLVRRRRLVDGLSLVDGASLQGREVLEGLAARDDAHALAEAGLRTKLLAGWARELGLRPTAEELAEAERDWLESLGVDASSRGEFLAASGLDAQQAAALCEELALEKLVLRNSQRMLSDAPSWEEGLAFEARRRGHWAAETVRRSKPRARR